MDTAPEFPAPRLALALAVACTGLLAGCRGQAEPAGHRPDPVAVSSPTSTPAAAPGSPAVTATTATAPGAPAPVAPSTTATGRTSAAPTADLGPALADIDRALADIDRALADLDIQLTDADHDVATPEGDIR